MKRLIFTFLLVLWTSPVWGQVARYENKEYGFRFVSPEGWPAVPIQGESAVLVARFNGPDFVDPKARIQFGGIGEVMVLPKAGPTTGEEKPGEKMPALTRQDMELAAAALGWESYLKKRLGDFEEKRRRKVDVGGHEGHQVWLEHGKEGVISSWCLVIERELFDVVVRYDLPTFRMRKRDDRMISAVVIKSFEWFEPEKEGEVDLTQMSARERTAYLVKRDLPDGYFMLETDRYVIISNTSQKITSEVAHQLEKIRDLYEKIFPPEKPIEAVSKVRVFADRDDYLAYGAPPSSAGFWSPRHEELVMYDNTASDKNDTFAVLRHEAFHQYIFYRCGELSPHSWFNEGYGDYFSGAKYRGGAFGPGKFLWRTPVLKKALQEDKVIPLKDILRFSQAQYYQPDIRSICYAQGWSIVYFLREGRLRRKEWGDILDKYLAKLIETRDRVKALDYALDGINIDELEAEWKKFAGKL